MSGYRVHYYPGTEALKDDEMRVIALGTGMPFVRVSQASACWLVEVPSRTRSYPERFLFDIGTGSMAKYAALQIPFNETTRAFISHLHSDHWGDFWPFWIGGLAQGRTVGIEVFGPDGETPEMGTRSAVEKAIEAMKWDVATRQDFFSALGGTDNSNGMEDRNAHEESNGDVQTGTIGFDIEGLNVTIHEFSSDKQVTVYSDPGNDVTIKSWPADHALPGAISYSLEWNGLKFVYSGDTRPLEGELETFKEHFQGAALVVHEWFTPAASHSGATGATLDVPTTQHAFHTTPEQFGLLMAEYAPAYAVAYHFFNDFDTSLDTYNRVRQNYQGPLSMAKDMLVWNVTPEGIIARNIAHHEDSWLEGLFEDPSATGDGSV